MVLRITSNCLNYSSKISHSLAHSRISELYTSVKAKMFHELNVNLGLPNCHLLCHGDYTDLDVNWINPRAEDFPVPVYDSELA